jgi:subtilase family serine protease
MDTVLQSHSVPVPNLDAGQYYIHIKTNPYGGLFENGMTANNVASSSTPISITPVVFEDPNLDPSSLSELSSVDEGLTYSITVNVLNNGEGNAIGFWDDALYFSESPVFDPENATLLTIDYVSEFVLSQDGYESVFSFVATDSLPETFYLHVWIDANSGLDETDEVDNIISSGPIVYNSIEEVYSFDLNVTSAFIENQIDDDYVLSWEVVNTGNTSGFITSWRDGLYVSSDQVFDETDILIDQWVISETLNPGNSYDRLEFIQIPPGEEGLFYLFMYSDWEQDAGDIDYNNNWQLVGSVNNENDPYEIDLPPQSDLTALNFDHPNTCIAGQPITLTFEIKNNGGDIVNGAHTDAIYLSTDAILDFNDIELGSFLNFDSLLTNESYLMEVNVFVPIDYLGNYVLILKTDDNNARSESNENNNIELGTLFVGQNDPCDLVITQIVALPDTVLLGGDIELTWYRTNQGAFDALGYLEDAVFISSDSVLSIDDFLLGVQLSTTGLPPGASEMISANFELMFDQVGDYYFIVRTDVQNNINETNDNNNTTSSFVTTHITLPTLPLEILTPDTLQLETDLYYKFIVDPSMAGEVIEFSLTGDDLYATNELYVSFEELPTRWDSQFQFDNPFEENQSVIVPNVEEGTYYILSYSANSAPSNQPIELYAERLPFLLDSIEANVGGNTGSVTVSITGSRFEPGMLIWLENESGQIPVTSLFNTTVTSTFATFNLLNAPLGIYDVYGVNEAQDTSILVQAFEIVQGTLGNNFIQLSCSNENSTGAIMINGEDILDLQYIHQLWTRPNRVVPITFRMENIGNVDIPVPTRFVISLQGAPISFDEADFSEELQELFLEFLEEDGPEDILRPGGISYITIYAHAIEELQFQLID